MRIIGLIILLCSYTVVFSQQSKIEEFELKYKLTTLGTNDKVIFIAVIPFDIPGVQKVISVDYSHPPSNSYWEDENKYVEFTFLNVEEEELIIKVRIEIFPQDLKKALKKPIEMSLAQSSYLSEEKYIETNSPEILEEAKKLKKREILQTVKKTYEFVNKKLSFVFSLKDAGALYALETGRGDCSEYSDLFVALCRANKIPARVTEGLITDFNLTPLHSWVEVYFNKYGWVSFDPTPGNAISFTELPNKYIKFSSIRNDARIFNGHRWGWRHWGDNVSIKEEIKIIK